MRRNLATSAAAFAAAIASFGAPAGAAVAAGPAPSSTAPKPAAPAAQASARLVLPDAFFVRGGAVTVPGRMFHANGVVSPYIPGQWADVKTYLGHRLIKSDRLRIKPSPNGRSGVFTEKVRSTGAGILHVKASHSRTPQMLGFTAQRGIASVGARAGFGSSGTFVALVQQRLAALHFYIPQSGVYDQKTGLAVDAYHRLLGRGTSQNLDSGTIGALLNGVGKFQVRSPHDGTHVEGNLHNQLLALIYGSKVYRIYPISSGKPSTPTILGHFHVYLRTPGYLPDGMYYSDFFYGGYAIHGYDPAPDYAASHGCMRLPIVDAISVFNWLTYGVVVDVYA